MFAKEGELTAELIQAPVGKDTQLFNTCYRGRDNQAFKPKLVYNFILVANY